jgi:DNA mismatch endonuclease (patch repair protein)
MSRTQGKGAGSSKKGETRNARRDIVDRATRSKMMSGIRGKDSQPELRVRSFLHRAGLRYRLHGRRLPGRPDIVLASYRTVVFVHGCFWHQHPGCKYAYHVPWTRNVFWSRKLSENIERDRANTDALKQADWSVIVVWECETTDRDLLGKITDRIRGNAQRIQPQLS